MRNGDGWFAGSDVGSLFEVFRVPRPGNIDRDLAHLRGQGYVVHRNRRPSWSVTPVGRERQVEIVGSLDANELAAELLGAPGAELGHVLHTLLPAQLAPSEWAPAIQRMLKSFPFEQNVFCMTRFPEDDDDSEFLDPVERLLPALRQALDNHGLTMHLASDRQLDDDLYGNIAAHMWACKFGIGLFEDRLGRGLNENMLVEVGSMLVIGRRCALLRDISIQRMPTDFIGRIYKEADFSDVVAVTNQAHRWAADDLGLGRCSSCPAV